MFLPVDSFSDELEKISTELASIPGGKAQGHQLEEFDPRQLAMGAQVEREHTKDIKKRLEIAADHLVEDERYYDKLDRAGLADEMKKQAVSWGEITQRFNKAVTPKTMGALLTGLGAGELVAHGPWGKGGRGLLEAHSEKELAQARKALKAAKPGTPEHEQAQKDLLHATSRYKNRVSGAESAGQALLGTGAIFGGWRGARALDNSLIKGERGATTAQQADALRQILSPSANVHMTAGSARLPGIAAAGRVPEGNFLSPALQQELQTHGVTPNIAKVLDEVSERGIPDELIVQGITQGVPPNTLLVPSTAGRHAAAYELAQHAASKTTLGKLTRMLSTPAMIGGSVGAMSMAMGDPDSKKSKLAPLVGLAGMLPSLATEGVASFRALRALKQVGVTPQELSHAKAQLAKGVGGKALQLGAIAVAAPVLTRLVRKYQRKRRAEAGLPTTEQAEKLYQKVKAQR